MQSSHVFLVSVFFLCFGRLELHSTPVNHLHILVNACGTAFQLFVLELSLLTPHTASVLMFGLGFVNGSNCAELRKFTYSVDLPHLVINSYFIYASQRAQLLLPVVIGNYAMLVAGEMVTPSCCLLL